MNDFLWKESNWVQSEYLRNYMYLTGDINDETARPVIEWIMFHNARNSNRRTKSERSKTFSSLYLFIDSGGGDSAVGLSIASFIKSSTIPIHTIGSGTVGSAALLIFMAGHDRTLVDTTSVLSHQFSWATEGRYHDMLADHTELLNAQQRMAVAYQKATRLPLEVINAELLPAANRWLTAEQAHKFNLCDRVVEKVDLSGLIFVTE